MKNYYLNCYIRNPNETDSDFDDIISNSFEKNTNIHIKHIIITMHRLVHILYTGSNDQCLLYLCMFTQSKLDIKIIVVLPLKFEV